MSHKTLMGGPMDGRVVDMSYVTATTIAWPFIESAGVTYVDDEDIVATGNPIVDAEIFGPHIATAIYRRSADGGFVWAETRYPNRRCRKTGEVIRTAYTDTA